MRYFTVLVGICSSLCFQPDIFALVTQGIDLQARFEKRMQWIDPLEWKEAQTTLTKPFQFNFKRFQDHENQVLSYLNSLPLMQTMSEEGKAVFSKATATYGKEKLIFLSPFNIITDNFALGQTADTRLNLLVGLGRACLNLPLYGHSFTITRTHMVHHTQHAFPLLDLHTYAKSQYDRFLANKPTSEMGFENGEFCSAVVLTLTETPEYVLDSASSYLFPKWGEFRVGNVSHTLLPFSPRYESSVHQLIQDVYRTYGHKIMNHSPACSRREEAIKIQQEQRDKRKKSEEIREKKNVIATSI